MTEVSILIPWRNGEKHREAIFRWTQLRWLELLPHAELVVAGDDSEPFNRSRARNNAFANSFGDVVVLADADTVVPDRQSIEAAVELAEEGHWVLPYEVYYNAAEADTALLLDRRPSLDIAEPAQWEFRLTDSISGVIVLPRAAYEAAGGYDERFVGWGFEDRAFADALNTLWGPCRRLPGFVVHLWHPVGARDAFGNPSIRDNQSRWLQYRRATGNPTAMRELVAR
jgi:predicted glycosyltransferase involved in capsule biosynthesis